MGFGSSLPLRLQTQLPFTHLLHKVGGSRKQGHDVCRGGEG